MCVSKSYPGRLLPDRRRGGVLVDADRHWPKGKIGMADGNHRTGSFGAYTTLGPEVMEMPHVYGL